MNLVAGFSLHHAYERMDRMAQLIRGRLHEREDDFLALGARFMEFSSASRLLSKKASDLAELTTGGAIEQGIEQLSGELNDMTSACDFTTSEASLSELKGLLSVIAELMEHVESFGRVVRSLQMLGISTRIESARLGSRGLGFATLADDVEKLAHMIVAKSSSIMEKSKSLHGMIQSVHQRTQELTHTQRGCSDRIMTEVGGNLDSLLSMAERSKQVIGDLSVQTAEISRNISEVVASMQFHDIVRQQVEHVDEALQDMMGMIKAHPVDVCSEADADSGSGEPDEAGAVDAIGADAETGDAAAETGDAGDGREPDAEPELEPDMCAAAREADDRELVGWIADVTAIQVSQLDHSANRLEEAVAGIKGSLMGIAATVQGMGEDVAGIIETDDADDDSVLDRIAEGSASVIASMREFTDKAAEIGGLMATVAGTVSEIAAFVDDIEDVGSEIELIALNAAIKAAHTGDEGRALGVLAGAIQHLSTDARGHTHVVSDMLRRIADAAASLESNASQYTETGQLKAMAVRQEELMDRLRQVNATFQSLFGEVGQESEALGLALEELAGGITLDQDVCPGLNEARKELDELVRLAREAVPEADDVGRPERLRELLARYTMEAERMVHETAFGSAAMADDGGDEVDLFGDDGDDDGVELFGGDDGDDGVELFGDDDGADGGVELFGDDDGADGVELFGEDKDEDGDAAGSPASEDAEGMGDNVELF